MTATSTSTTRRALLALAVATLGCNPDSQPDKARVKPLDGLPEAGEVPSRLRMGITPSAGKDTAALLTPLGDYLGKYAQLELEGHTAPSYDHLADMVNGGSVDVGVFSPGAYVTAAKKGLEAVALATATRGGSPTYLGYLLCSGTRRDARLEDLAGDRIAWVDRASTSGYLYPRAMLRARGLDPASFFGGEIFAGDHRASIDALLAGKVEVAAAASPFVDPDSDVRAEGVDALAVIAKTWRIPLDCVVLHKRIQRALGERLQRALLALSSDDQASRALAKTWGHGGFVRPLDERYAEVGRLIEQES